DPDPDLSDPMDPFKVNQAEDFTDSNGVTIVNGDGGSVVRFDSTSGWISFEYDFSSGPQTIDIRSASAGWGANVYFKVDSSDGQTFSTIYPNGGGLWYTNSNSCWPRPTGVKTVYIMTNKAGLELNWFEIKK
nr:carbohydrate-binding protein [Spirochaetota bacterium]